MTVGVNYRPSYAPGSLRAEARQIPSWRNRLERQSQTQVGEVVAAMRPKPAGIWYTIQGHTGTPIRSMLAEFEQLKRGPSLATRVTEEMLASIASGRVKPGQPLPSERELSEQFGVSRTVVREAVRGLEAKGVLEVLSGRGARVASVPASRVLEALDLYMRGGQSQNIISAADISEVRTTLELKLVELACARATEADLEELLNSHRAMSEADTPTVSGAHDAEFHRNIAVATHNALFVTLLDSINAPMMPIRIRSLTRPGRQKLALAQHQDILEAIQKRDRKAAWTAMDRHLEDSRHYYTAKDQGGEPSDG